MAGMNLEGTYSSHGPCHIVNPADGFIAPACFYHVALTSTVTRVFSPPARKTKKLNRLKGAQVSNPPEVTSPPPVESYSLVLSGKFQPQLVPTMLSLLKAIEPDTIYAGYDSSLPDTSTRLMTTLNRLGGRRVISAVKWAKALPGEWTVTEVRLLLEKVFEQC